MPHLAATGRANASIAKVVNPLGTVTTTASGTIPEDEDEFDQFLFHGDAFIHENCDEALFRPVVAVFGSTGQIGGSANDREAALRQQVPADIGQSLVVPVTELKQPTPKVDPKPIASKQPVPLERKKSDTAKPVVVQQTVAVEQVVDPPCKPTEVDLQPILSSKASKKAQKKAAAAAAAKLLEATIETEVPSVKAKNKSRRNSSVKVDELQCEAIPVEILPSIALVTDTPPEDHITTMSLAKILQNMDTDQATQNMDLPAPVWVEPPVPAVRSSKKSNSKNNPIDELTVIECFEQEFSSIQDSIFVAPVVTSTVVLKKSGRKTKAAAIIETSPIQDNPPEVTDHSTKDSDSVELEFVDAFAPLEPFELNFELVPVKHENFDEMEPTADDFVSLINFASPLQEEATNTLADELPSTTIRTNRSGSDYSPFQSCVEFVEQDDIDDEDEDELNSEEPPVLLYECQDSDYKSLEQEVDESTYLSFDQPPALLDEEPVMVTSMPNSHSNSSSPSSGEESSSQITTTSINVPAVSSSSDSTNPVATYKPSDDEELQPLITRSILNHLLTGSMDESLPFPQSADVELGQPLEDAGDPNEELQDAKARQPLAAVNRPKKNRRKRR